MATFISSQRGGQKLIHQGFIYHKKRNGANGQRYWMCEQWKIDKCTAYAITDANNAVSVTQQHNHGPSPNRVELAKIKSRIKQAAETSPAPPLTLVNTQLAGISDETKATLPKLVNLAKMVSRKRRTAGQQSNGQPANPEERAAFSNIIPEMYSTSELEPDHFEQFLLADSGVGEANGILNQQEQPEGEMGVSVPNLPASDLSSSSYFFGMQVAAAHQKLVENGQAQLALDFQEAVMSTMFAFERRALNAEQIYEENGIESGKGRQS